MTLGIPVLSAVMLSVIMLSAVMLSVIMLSANMLSVVVAFSRRYFANVNTILEMAKESAKAHRRNNLHEP